MTAQKKYITSLLSVFSTFLESHNVSRDLALLTTEKFVTFINVRKSSDAQWVENWSIQTLEKFLTAQNVPHKSAVLMKKFVESYTPLEVDVFLHQFLASLKANKRANSTIKNYRSDIQQFSNLINCKKINQLFEPDNLRSFVHKQIDSGLKISTVKRKLSSISQFALWAENEKIVKDASFWISDIESLVTGNSSIKYKQPLAHNASYTAKSPSKELEDFLLSLEIDKHSAATVKNYKSDIKQFLDHSTKSKLNKIITQEEVTKFVVDQRKLGLKANSIKRKLSSISKFALWAESRNSLHGVSYWIHQLPAKLFEVSKPKTPVVKSSNTSPAKQVTPTLKLKTNELVHAHQKHTKTPKVAWSLPVPDFATDTSVKKHQGHVNLKKENIKEDKKAYSGIRSSLNDFANQINTKRNKKFLPYLNLVMMVIFVIGLGFLGYQQFITQAPTPFAYPSSPTRPNRELSFQGRLTDTAQNPIITSTNMAFRLYDDVSAGTQLWSSGSCSVTPDQDGIFNVGLGDDCGSEITEDVFTENSNVWLEVEIASETLTPRQSIKTVAYALNSETVQGYPVSATGAATTNTILVMDSAGQVLLGEVSPTLKSTTGTFSIEAQALTLQTSSASDGDIILDPDGIGEVLSTGYFSAPGATFSATYADGTSLVLKGGPSGTGNIQEWQDSSGSVLSVVDAGGNVGIGTDTPLANLHLFSNSSGATADTSSNEFIMENSGNSGMSILTPNTSVGRISFGDPENSIAGFMQYNHDGDFMTIGVNGVARYLFEPFELNHTGPLDLSTTTGQITISPAGSELLRASSDGVGIGTGSTINALFHIKGTSDKIQQIIQAATSQTANLTEWQDSSGTTLTVIDPSGNIGIGSSSPAYTLDLVGEFNITDAIRLNTDAGTSGYFLTSSAGGINTWTDPDTITGAGLWDITSNVYHPKDKWAEVVDLTLGGTSTASANIHLQSDGQAYFGGNVGIGTTNPNYILDIIQPSETPWAPHVRLHNTNAGGTSSTLLLTGELSSVTRGFSLQEWNYASDYQSMRSHGAHLILGSDGEEIIFGKSSSNLIGQDSNFDEWMTIQNGNVGIGTTDPTEKLEISGTSPNIKITATSGNSGLIFANTASRFQTYLDSSTNNYIIDSINGGVAPSITVQYSDGNVGIGTTTPLDTLDVNGNVRRLIGDYTSRTLELTHINVKTNYVLLFEKPTASSGENGAIVEGTFTIHRGTTTASNNDRYGRFLASRGYNASYNADIIWQGGDAWPVTFSEVDYGGKTYIALKFAYGTSGTGIILDVKYREDSGTFDSNFLTSVTEDDVTGEVADVGSMGIATNFGNVGIGTTAPTAALHLGNSGESTGTYLFKVDGTAATGGFLAYGNNIEMLAYRSSAQELRIGDSGYLAINPPTNGAIIQGNVGIGTSSPGSYKLDVAGDINLSSAIYANGDAGTSGYFLTSSAGGANTWTDPDSILSSGYWDNTLNILHPKNEYASIVDLALGGDSTASANIHLRSDGQAYFAGKVGIGTTSPSTYGLVDIVGTVQNEGLRISQTGYDDIYLTNRDGQNNWPELRTTGDELKLSTASQDGLITLNTTNVGIGTTTPGALLQIGGTTTATRYAQISDVGIATFRYDNNANAIPINIQNRNTTAGISHTAAIDFDFGRTSDSTARAAGRLTFLKEQEWTSTSTTNDSAFTIATTIDGSLTEKFRVQSDGNVGIGTTTPGSLLHISSGTTGNANLKIESDTDNNNDADQPSLTFSQDGGAVTGQIGFFDSGDHFELKTTHANSDIRFSVVNQVDALTIHRTNGNIGIGTTDPAFKLNIENGSLMVGGSHDTISLPTTWTGSGTTNDGLSISYDQTNKRGRITSIDMGASFSPLYFQGNEFRWSTGAGSVTEKMTLLENGNLGIGSTIPNEVLDVAGNVQFSGSLEPAGLAGIANQILISQGAGNAPTWSSSVPASSLAWDDLTAPDANLSLAMSTYTTAFNYATGTGANNLFSFTTDASANGTGSLVNIQTGASASISPLRVRAGSVESIFVQTNGNVGIGSIVPAHKLDIEGSLGFGTIGAAGFDNYSVSVTDTVFEELIFAGNSLDTNEVYRVTLATRNTGVNTGYVGVVWYDVDVTAWQIRHVSQSASGSNHPYLVIDTGVVKVRTDHVTSYTVAVTISSSTGDDDNHVAIFGADSMWQRANADLYYTDGGVGIGTTTPGGATLDVKGSLTRIQNAGDTELRIDSIGGTNNNSIINFRENVADRGSIYFDGAANDFIWSSTIGDISLMPFGSVGIGTATPGAPLDMYLNNTNTVQPGFRIQQDGTGDASTVYLLTGVRNWATGVDNSDADKFKIGMSSDLATNNYFTIDIDGNVGIGTTTPSEKLTIYDGATANQSYLKIEDRSVGTAVSPSEFGIKFNGYNGNERARISGTDEASNFDRGQLLFYTENNGAAGVVTEKMRISSEGNVGIGTTAPNELLHIVNTNSGANSVGIRLSNPGAGVGNAVSLDFQNFTTDGQGSRIQSYRSNAGNFQSDLVFYTNTGGTSTAITEKMRITDDGNVGIGTTTPGYKLDLVGEFNLTDAIRVAGNAGTSGYLLTSSAGGANTWTDPSTLGGGTSWWDNTLNVLHPKDEYASIADLAIGGNSTASANIHLQSNGQAYFAGNVGVGTSIPTYKLNILGADSTDANNTITNSQLAIEGTGATHGLYFRARGNSNGIGGNTYAKQIISSGGNDLEIYTTTVDSLVLGTNSTEWMRINSVGNVGIGTNNPEEKIHLINGEYKAESTNGTSDMIQLLNISNNDQRLELGMGGQAGNHQARIAGQYGLDIRSISDNAAYYMAFATADTERMRINNDGNLGIGTTNPLRLLDIRGDIYQYSTNPVIEIRNVSSSNTVGLDIGVGSFGTAADGYAINTSTTSSADLHFGTNNTIDMTILYGGNIGINTTTPTSLLHAYDGDIKVDRGSLIATQDAASDRNHSYRSVLQYHVDVDNQDGAMVITVPDVTNSMMNVRISGYNYNGTSGAWEVVIGGYWYTSGDAWINTSVEIKGKAPFDRVRLMSDNTGTTPVIVLGEATDVDNWDYPQINVDVDIAGYGAQDEYATGWAGAMSTDISALTAEAEPTIAYYWNSSGNLGIGTTNPANFKLQIAGDIGPTADNQYDLGSPSLKWDGIYATGNIIAAALSDSDLDTKISVEESADEDKIRFDTAGSERMIIDANGLVGIGTTTPIHKFEVNDSVTGKALVLLKELGDQDILTASNSAGVTRFRMANTGYMYAERFVDVSNSAYYVDPAGGTTSGVFASNVGIGSVSPGSKLDVRASYTNTSGVNNTVSIIPSHTGAGGGVTLNAMLTDIDTLGTTLTTVRGHRIDIHPNTNSTIDYAYGIDVNASAEEISTGGITNVYGGNFSAQFGTNNYGLNVVVSDGTNHRGVNIQSDDYGIYSSAIRDYFSGNVGIGSTAPTEKLEVTGNILLSTANSVIKGPTGGWLKLESQGANKLYLNYDNPTNDIQLGKTGNSLDLSIFGNVGIGTSAPVYALDITGSGDGKGIRFDDGDAMITTHDGFGNFNFLSGIDDDNVITSSTNGVRTEMSDAGSLYHEIYTGAVGVVGTLANTFAINSTDAYINGSGIDFGIGTTAPAVALHINDAGDEMIRLQDTSASGSPYMSFYQTTTRRGYIQFNDGANTLRLNSEYGEIDFYTNGSERMEIDSTGNVGIGTTTADAKLEVNGAIHTNRLGTYGTYSSTQVQGIWSISEAYPIDTGLDDFGTQYGMGYAYNQNGGSPFAGEHQIVFTNAGTINAAIGFAGSGYFKGNVGIGTTTPTFDLEIGATTTSDTAIISVNGGSAIVSGEVAGLRLEDGGTTHGAWKLDASGTMQFQVENAAGATANLDFNTGASNNTIRFWPKGVKALELNSTTVTIPINVNDALNFTATSTNDNRGISFNSRTALSADSSDGWLRLNSASEFGNGIYSPLGMRADGGFQVGSSGNIFSVESTGNVSVGQTDGNDYLIVRRQNSTTEGGQIQLNQGGSYTASVQIDSWGNDMRVWNAPATTSQTQFFNNNGGNVMNVVTDGSASDYAETVFSAENMDGGDIIFAVEANNEDGITTYQTTTENDPRVIGVISTAPGSTLKAPMIVEEKLIRGTLVGKYTDDVRALWPELKPLALSGRVPVKVITPPGQSITTGKAIVSSSKKGIGQQATAAGMSVGKTITNFNPSALSCTPVNSVEDINWPSDSEGNNAAKPCYTLPDGRHVGKIMIMVSNSYIDPTIAITNSGSLAIAGDNINGYEVENESIAVSNISAFFELFVANITAGLTNTQTLIVEQTASITDLTVDTFTIQGMSLADYISSVVSGQTTSNSTALISPIDDSTLIQTASESGSVQITNGEDKTLAELNNDGDLSLLGDLNTDSITATGSSTLGSLLVETNATVSGTLTANTLETDNLTAQNSALGSLIANQATISGSLTIAQDATVAGTLVAGQIEAASSRIALLEAGMAELSHVKATTAEIVNATISGELHANTIYANSIYNFEETLLTTLQQPSLLDILMGTNESTASQDAMEDLYDTINKSEYNATSSADLDLSFSEISMTADDVTLTGTALFVEKYFKVNGSGYVSDSLAVGSSLFVGNTMQLADGLINYTTSDPSNQVLEIQPAGQGSIELLAGIVTIDDSGTVTVNGDLDVTGNAKIAGTLLTDQLKPTNFGNPFQVQVAGIDTQTNEVKKSRFEIINEVGTPVATFSAEGNAEFAGKVDIAGGIGIDSQDLGSSDTNELSTNKTSGKATIKSGANEVTIKTSIITDNTLIYVTAVGSTDNQVIYVKGQASEDTNTPEQEGQFVVGFDNNTTTDVSFNWWIVN